MAQIVRLRTMQQKAEQAAASELAELLRQLPEALLRQLPGETRVAISRATHGLQRHSRPDEGIWPGGFNMLSREQTKLAWNAIRALPSSKRPHQVRHAFDLVLLHLRQDTGEVMLSREQIAEEIGCAPKHVSTIMGTLEQLGIIRRERERIDGMKGRGVARYFVNAHVAWNGSLEARKKEAAKSSPPSLRLVHGAVE